MGISPRLPPEDSDEQFPNCKVKHYFASLSRHVREQYANYGQMLAKIGSIVSMSLNCIREYEIWVRIEDEFHLHIIYARLRG